MSTLQERDHVRRKNLKELLLLCLPIWFVFLMFSQTSCPFLLLSSLPRPRVYCTLYNSSHRFLDFLSLQEEQEVSFLNEKKKEKEVSRLPVLKFPTLTFLSFVGK